LDLANFCIQRYWSHTSNNKSHQSKEFREKFGEHFGTYKLYSKMLYNSGDYLGTTGSCQDHLLFVIIYFYLLFIYYIFNNLLIIYFIRCIDQMLDGIKPLADKVLTNLMKFIIQIGIKNVYLFDIQKKLKKFFKFLGCWQLIIIAQQNFI